MSGEAAAPALAYGRYHVVSVAAFVRSAIQRSQALITVREIRRIWRQVGDPRPFDYVVATLSGIDPRLQRIAIEELFLEEMAERRKNQQKGDEYGYQKNGEDQARAAVDPQLGDGGLRVDHERP